MLEGGINLVTRTRLRDDLAKADVIARREGKVK
jgi:hypothetical protein